MVSSTDKPAPTLSFYSPEVVVDSRRRARARAGVGLFIGALVLVAVGTWTGLSAGALVLLGVGALLGAVGAVRAGRRRRIARWGARWIVVRRDGVVVEGEGTTTIARRDIVGGHLSRDDEVTLQLRDGRDVLIATNGLLEGAGMVDTLGFFPERVYRGRLASAASRSSDGVRVASGLALAVCAAMALTGTALAALELSRDVHWAVLAGAAAILSWTAVAGLVMFFRDALLVVGAEGVRTRLFLRERSYPFSRIASVCRARDRVILTLDSGESVPLLVQGERFAHLERSRISRNVELLFQRIERAIAAARAGATSSRFAPALDRGARSADEWIRALDGLVAGEGGYRLSPILPDELASVAGDVTVSPERRVAAVLALRGCADPEVRLRVRIAAAGSADADLRLAIEAAAQGEVDEAALSRCRGH